MLRVSMGAVESCPPDKERLTVICPAIWIHYILSGKGYYNGRQLAAGQAFIIYKNDICEYYPDKNDPWTYVWIRLEGKDDEKLLRITDTKIHIVARSVGYVDQLSFSKAFKKFHGVSPGTYAASHRP